MKINIIVVVLALSLLVGCGISPPAILADDAVLGNAGMAQDDEMKGSEETASGDWDFGPYRPIYYDMPGLFADYVGRDSFDDWFSSLNVEERISECIAVSFIREFGISQRQFNYVNEELLELWLNIGCSPEESSLFEVYPVDLIYTFDNAAIDDYFLWENSPIPEERGVGYGTKIKKNAAVNIEYF